MKIEQETFRIDYTLNGEAKHFFITAGDEMLAANIFYHRFIEDHVFSSIPMDPKLQKINAEDVYKLVGVTSEDPEKLEDIINLNEKRNHKTYKVSYEYSFSANHDPIKGHRYVLAADEEKAKKVFEERNFMKLRCNITDVKLELEPDNKETILIHLGGGD